MIAKRFTLEYPGKELSINYLYIGTRKAMNSVARKWKANLVGQVANWAMENNLHGIQQIPASILVGFRFRKRPGRYPDDDSFYKVIKDAVAEGFGSKDDKNIRIATAFILYSPDKTINSEIVVEVHVDDALSQ